MTSKFGILGRLEFLQVIASKFIAGINPAVIHNIEKYLALKKAHYLTAVEHLEGDYLEFGVFTGSSFTHSMRCTSSMEKIYPGIKKCKFIGFDSFEGFGLLDEGDEHPFYSDENFETSFDAVYKRAAAAAGNYHFELKKGFFEQSLRDGALAHGIDKVRIVFMDSDTYSSAKCAFEYVSPVMQVGAYIILDDYFSYRGSKSKGVARAFNEFLGSSGISARRVMDYGMGGTVFVVDSIDA
ncbi:TylF/MycF family methyltransferase [Pseudomonadota bacterium]|nr:TylF/MycF family methyltransferase [Pseudomonadota bacterium]